MSTKKIGVYGASGFGREVAWLVDDCIRAGANFEIVFFIDDDESKHGKLLNGIPVVGLADAKSHHPDAAVVGGIGDPKIREKLLRKANRQGFMFETLIHPRVERSQWIEIGCGTLICAGNILTTNIEIGEQVQINLNCTIGHDVILGAYTTLAPGVHISGCVQFGKRVYVGTGAVIINGTQEKPLTIGDDAVIGAGACVTKSIPAGETWGGVPAKPLRK